MAAVSSFDKLFSITAPHILEKIFLSLDLKSFINCFRVSRSWNILLTSESFQEMAKPIFYHDLTIELWHACKKGNVQEVTNFFSSGLIDINHISKRHGRTCLSIAAENGQRGVVQELLDRGADPNISKFGLTPLYDAAREGHKDVVELLLDRGAEPNKVTPEERYTPLHRAVSKGHLHVVKVLLEKGASPNIRHKSGNTPLRTVHVSSMENKRDLMKVLLEGGAEPHSRNSVGGTPLHYFAEAGCTEGVQLLLGKGVDPNIVDRSGMTPLRYAVEKGHKHVVQLLIDAGANPNMADEKGKTPLIRAQEILDWWSGVHEQFRGQQEVDYAEIVNILKAKEFL